jgi:hypothetical protein
MAKKVPILTIDDITEREVVTVFGKEYELLDYEDIGLVKYSKFIKKYKSVGDSAEKADELSEEEFEAFDSSLTEMVETVLIGIPHEVAAKISVEKKQKVLACFFTVATKTLQATMERPKMTEGQSTTET